MQNPFVYGQVVRGAHFADRKGEKSELLSNLSRGQNVIVFSPRRFGKTSLILEVLDRLKAEGFITVYVDLYRITSKEKFITTFAQAISRSYSGKLKAVLRQLRNVLPRLIPKVVVRTDENVEFEFGYDPRSEETPVIEELLEATNERTKAEGKKAVVVFDEFQEITNWDDGEIEREMRSRFQMHEGVAYVFMGSKWHLMLDLFRNKNRPLYMFGKHFPLDKIPEDEFAVFIAEKFKKGGFMLSHEAVSKILEITEAHPYYTQLLCSVLWDRFVDSKRIRKEQIEAGVNEVLSRESHAYHAIWDSLSTKSRQVLEALALSPGARVYSASFLRRHNLGPASSVQKAVKRLEKEELIQRENDCFMFTDVFLRWWIQRGFS